MNSEPLLYWIEERESIRLRRSEGVPQKNWTNDSIFQAYRFCNVRRRDDRVSQWIVHNIIEPYANHPNLWIMLALARYVNWTDTLSELMTIGLWPADVNPHWIDIGGVIDARTKRGDQTWTGAYMIRAESNPNAEWYSWGKGRYVAEKVIGRELWANRRDIVPRLSRSVEEAHDAISGHYGWGSFMTGQVVADLTYSPVLASARDLCTWAPLGPGSRRGLNRLTGRPTDAPLTQEKALEEMRDLYAEVVLKLPELEDMTLHDLQNCLCETDKYLRAKTGEGRPRSHFHPRGI